MLSRSRLGLAFLLACPFAATAQTPCILDDSGWNSQEGGCKDLSSDLVWSGVYGSMTWANATTHAANLVDGGQSDWRLPTLAELQTAYANGAATHLNLLGPGVWYWSSTRVQAHGGGKNFQVWTVDLFTGQSRGITNNSRLYFLCVRQGTAQPISAPDRAPHAMQFASDDRWTVRAELPAHASRTCWTFAAILPPASPFAVTALPGAELATATCAAPTLLERQRIDERGSAVAVLEASAIVVPEGAFTNARMLFAVDEARGTAPALYTAGGLR